MTRTALLALLVAACGADKYATNPDGSQNADANPGSDANPGCSIAITFTPSSPVAPITVRAAATVFDGPGVLDYTWTVKLGTQTIQTTYASPTDHSQVDFDAMVAGSYDVTVKITPQFLCPDGVTSLTVAAPNANFADYRVRVWPPPQLAPTQEQVVRVYGGGDFGHSITLDPGIAISGTISAGGTGVPADLRFMPVAAPDAYVESFAASDGTYNARLLGQSHQVLIVPAAPGLAPKLASWSTTASSDFTVGAGHVVTGSVLDSGGNPVAGAQVQLAAAGVPSSLATTASNGSFTLHDSFATGAMVDATIVPPAGSGLARLAASSAFDLTQPLVVRYASLATCNVGGVAVQRGGANKAGAQVTFVGALAGTAGTVTAGSAANATGSVQIAATADATGHLPSTLAPKVALSAVVAIAPGDLAVTAVNLATCPPPTIVAPAQLTAAGKTVDPTLAALSGVQLDAAPSGALASAAATAVQTSSTSTGAYSIRLASGGTYDVRFSDPLGRAAPLVLLGVTPASLPASAMLAAALHVTGVLSVSGGASQLPGASIQVLCTGCSGVDASRPIAETATDATGSFRLAVPDPGTM